ncbi:MAG: flagellar motor stator protein MotA [Alphaproteobacteria bacterium]|jgi:chemotaxis protein MotA|nr:flagellar motor stator protein MotA [Alphaproteobacteria bacterium]
MLTLVGIVIVMVMVFGGYVLAGGKFGVIVKALPFELMMIGGAGLGSYLVANPAGVLKRTGGAVMRCFVGGKWRGDDYIDMLCLLFALIRTIKAKGIIALEHHIESPKQSPIFQRYPKILKDHFAVDFICDTLRMMSMNLDNPHQVEDMMEKVLDKHHEEAAAPAHALATLGEAFPALGIVAAVLGVIKTMSAVDQPPEILGKMIAGALTGTFLGVFLSYGIVSPMAAKVKASIDEDHHFYLIIRDVLVAFLHGNAPQVAVEIGRGSVPSVLQPNYAALESAIDEVPKDA